MREKLHSGTSFTDVSNFKLLKKFISILLEEGVDEWTLEKAVLRMFFEDGIKSSRAQVSAFIRALGQN